MARSMLEIIPPERAFFVNASFIMVWSRAGIWFRFVIMMISPIVMNIIIIIGNILLHMFDIVFIPFIIAMVVRIVTIMAIRVLFRLYISFVRVVIVLF